MKKAAKLVFLSILLSLAFMNGGTAQVPSVAEVGDIINITVQEQDRFSGAFKVDRYGNITLPPPVGALYVLGLTADQISSKLTERLSEYIIKPTVFVAITKAAGFIVHIVGEVRLPSFYELPEGSTLQELITQAGGFTELADIKNIRLIRRGKDGKSREFTINFSQFIENGYISANPILEPNDLVIVPRLPTVGRLIVLGAVVKPGSIELTKPIPLLEAISRAGGAIENADLQNVYVITRKEEGYSWEKVDLESFLVGKDLSANPMVSPGTQVFVPKRVEKVSFMVNVMGQVVNPSVYALPEGARLLDAICAAGGFADEASIDEITIIHTTGSSPRVVKADVGNYLATGDRKDNPPLKGGDIVFVPLSKDAKKIPSIQTAFFETIRVSIIGEVNKPGTYRISKNASVLDVLKLAGGPTAEADLERVTLIRERTNLTAETKKEEQRKRVNLEKVLTEGLLELMPPLQTGDTIFVPRIKEKRNIWRAIVRFAADVATIAVAYYLVTGQRYFR